MGFRAFICIYIYNGLGVTKGAKSFKYFDVSSILFSSVLHHKPGCENTFGLLDQVEGFFSCKGLAGSLHLKRVGRTWFGFAFASSFQVLFARQAFGDSSFQGVFERQAIGDSSF